MKKLKINRETIGNLTPSALEHVHGPVTRMLLSAAGWSRRPHHVDVDGRLVTLGYFSDQPASLLTASCGGGDSVALQIVPASADREEQGTPEERGTREQRSEQVRETEGGTPS